MVLKFNAKIFAFIKKMSLVHMQCRLRDPDCHLISYYYRMCTLVNSLHFKLCGMCVSVSVCQCVCVRACVCVCVH